jgi:hypothetical protein
MGKSDPFRKYSSQVIIGKSAKQTLLDQKKNATPRRTRGVQVLELFAAAIFLVNITQGTPTHAAKEMSTDL